MPLDLSPSLARRLAALLGLEWLAPDAIEPVPARGVAHDHYRIRGHGLLLRAPRATPWALPAEEQLAGEATAFRRTAPSGATPRLHAVLAPDATLPRGALLVEEVAGRSLRLPEDLPALAEALARLHALPLPPPAERPPLPDHGAAGPFAATLALIERQRPYAAEADLAPATRDALAAELAWARDFAARTGPDQPLALVGSDTHPGNFLRRRRAGGGEEVLLVDLERVLYGSPAIDLAHASLYTSTAWDPEVRAVLDPAETQAFYRHYLELIGAAAARRLAPWLAPCRRLTWLRTMTWFARWQAIAATGALSVDPRLDAHIRDRLAEFLDPATVARLRREWLEAPPAAS